MIVLPHSIASAEQRTAQQPLYARIWTWVYSLCHRRSDNEFFSYIWIDSTTKNDKVVNCYHNKLKTSNVGESLAAITGAFLALGRLGKPTRASVSNRHQGNTSSFLPHSIASEEQRTVQQPLYARIWTWVYSLCHKESDNDHFRIFGSTLRPKLTKLRFFITTKIKTSNVGESLAAITGAFLALGRLGKPMRASVSNRH